MQRNLPDYRLRPAQADDEAFLFVLYRSTRSAELAMLAEHPEQAEMFLRLQYHAQEQHYRAQSEAVEQQVILMDGQLIGRLLVLRLPDELRLADIALLPDWRNCGIGADLIGHLQAEAQQAGLPLRLHVAYGNPAIRLYERLGFVTIHDTGSHQFMEWSKREASSSLPENTV